MEARMQAELLYALRAITRYMTWSVVLVYLFVLIFLLLLKLDTLINVKTTKNGKNKTEEEEEWAAAEGDDKVVLLKEKKRKNNCQLNLLAESLVWLLSLQCQNWPLGGVGPSEQNPSSV